MENGSNETGDEKILTSKIPSRRTSAKLVQRRSTGKVADEKDSDNDERPKIIDIEQEEEEKRRAQMNKVNSLAIRADKQKLKLEEFELLARGNRFQSFQRMKTH